MRHGFAPAGTLGDFLGANNRAAPFPIIFPLRPAHTIPVSGISSYCPAQENFEEKEVIRYASE